DRLGKAVPFSGLRFRRLLQGREIGRRLCRRESRSEQYSEYCLSGPQSYSARDVCCCPFFTYLSNHWNFSQSTCSIVSFPRYPCAAEGRNTSRTVPPFPRIA